MRTISSASIAVLACLTLALAAHAAARPAAPAKAVPAAAAPAAPDTVDLIILHVNDVHGQTQPVTEDGRSLGGYARLATAVDEIRKANRGTRVFLFHAGDEFSRGDDLTRATKGAANIAIMNRLKFDAWTPGNGDFYDGPAELLDRISEANFHCLAANVRYKDPDEPVGKPYYMEEAGPVRVAVVGLCRLSVDDPSFGKFVMADPTETARRVVAEVRPRADLVVALTHLGALTDQRLAGAVQGIDLVIGGHSHSAMTAGRVAKSPDGRDVLIAQAGEQLRYLGVVRVKMEKTATGYRLKEAAASLVPLDEKVKLDAAITALIARLAEQAGKSARPAEKPAAPAPTPAPAAPAEPKAPVPVG